MLREEENPCFKPTTVSQQMQKAYIIHKNKNIPFPLIIPQFMCGTKSKKNQFGKNRRLLNYTSKHKLKHKTEIVMNEFTQL